MMQEQKMMLSDSDDDVGEYKNQMVKTPQNIMLPAIDLNKVEKVHKKAAKNNFAPMDVSSQLSERER